MFKKKYKQEAKHKRQSFNVRTFILNLLLRFPLNWVPKMLQYFLAITKKKRKK